MSSPHGPIWIVTGARGIGKTRFCQNLIRKASQKAMSVEGIICPPGFTGADKTSIQVQSIKTGERFQLARVRNEETDGLITDHWIFDAEVMKWGDQVLAKAGECDLLIVDELGPLEFERGEGWQSGLLAVDKGQYEIAVVVIRPELLTLACQRWPSAKVIEIPALLDERSECQLQEMILSSQSDQD